VTGSQFSYLFANRCSCCTNRYRWAYCKLSRIKLLPLQLPSFSNHFKVRTGTHIQGLNLSWSLSEPLHCLLYVQAIPGCPHLVSRLLQALRWRLIRTPAGLPRFSLLTAWVQADLLQLLLPSGESHSTGTTANPTSSSSSRQLLQSIPEVRLSGGEEGELKLVLLFGPSLFLLWGSNSE
jgi:hypothetical protein